METEVERGLESERARGREGGKERESEGEWEGWNKLERYCISHLAFDLLVLFSVIPKDGWGRGDPLKFVGGHEDVRFLSMARSPQLSQEKGQNAKSGLADDS